jgi:hypothetical protein
VRVPDKDFTGKQMMVILCDRYGNEKSLLLERREFEGKSRRTTKRSAKGRAKKVGKKK